MVVDTVILRLSFPILAVGLAVMAEDRGWGLLNNIDVPVWVAIIVSMLLLDLAIYLQHVMFHAVPGLWRLHRMHHADLDFDATTGLRFHPVEILISMLTPVLMTALSAGVALIPLMLGADAPGKEILHPVAITIFGGLVTATILDTVLTPTLFLRYGRVPLERLVAQARAEAAKQSHDTGRATAIEAY